MSFRIRFTRPSQSSSMRHWQKTRDASLGRSRTTGAGSCSDQKAHHVRKRFRRRGFRKEKQKALSASTFKFLMDRESFELSCYPRCKRGDHPKQSHSPNNSLVHEAGVYLTHSHAGIVGPGYHWIAFMETATDLHLRLFRRK